MFKCDIRKQPRGRIRTPLPASSRGEILGLRCRPLRSHGGQGSTVPCFRASPGTASLSARPPTPLLPKCERQTLSEQLFLAFLSAGYLVRDTVQMASICTYASLSGPSKKRLTPTFRVKDTLTSLRLLRHEPDSGNEERKTR